MMETRTHPRFRHFPRVIAWLTIFFIFGLVAVNKADLWAAPVVHAPNQTVPSPQQTHLPLVAFTPPDSCALDLTLCKLLPSNTLGFFAYDWSPDGRMLAFVWEEDDVFGLYTMDDQSQDRRLLLALDDIVSIRYSPDGTMIALTVSRPDSRPIENPADGSNVHDLYIYTLATGQLRPLSDATQEDFSDTAPNWSPDSSRLVFTRIEHNSTTGESTTGDLYTIRPDGSELTQLTDTSLHESGGTYSPDGTRIAYISVDVGSNNPSIAVMEANGDDPTILTSDDEFFANHPFWAPDGNTIYFFGATERDNAWDIYRIGAEGDNLVNITHDALQQSDLALSPDGSQILFIGRVETPETFEIDFYTVDLDGSNLTKYPNPHGAGRHPSGVQWHPDGQRISYSLSTELYLLHLEMARR